LSHGKSRRGRERTARRPATHFLILRCAAVLLRPPNAAISTLLHTHRCTHTYTCTHTNICSHPYVYTHICTRTYVHAHPHMYTPGAATLLCRQACLFECPLHPSTLILAQTHTQLLPHRVADRLANLHAHCTHTRALTHTHTHKHTNTHTCSCCHTVLQAGLPAWVLTAAAAATARGVEAREVAADSAPHTRLGEGQLAELSTCSSSRGAATRTGPQVPEELDARWQCYT